MTEPNNENRQDLQSQAPERRVGGELDAAGRSLSEALRISFVILKIIMIVLVLVFLASGFRTVGSDEKALVLQFGKIHRVLKPGPHWVFPYPIEEIIKIPVGKKVNLGIGSFWYFQTPDEMLPAGWKTRPRIGSSLDPVRDGYCITRNEKGREISVGFAGGDYNIVHCKWQLIYQIDSERPELFFKNVYVDSVRPGEAYFDVMTKSITPFLESVVEDAVVTAMVNYTIDEAISSQDRIRRHVQSLVQKKLDGLRSGIEVVSLQLTRSEWPRQVDQAFDDFIRASQSSQAVISEARTYAETTLSEAAGPVAEELFAVLKGKAVSEQEEEFLWENVAGSAREKIAQARAYRTKVVKSAEANADYLQKILPEFNKSPKLVLQDIYLDAIEQVLNNADEKFILQPAKGTKGREIRVLLNRDQTIKRESEEK
ncbi:MAG: protease modulator HflK [Planctomycetota bacterium]|jgi:membrane protease subunit HflK